MIEALTQEQTDLELVEYAGGFGDTDPTEFVMFSQTMYLPMHLLPAQP